MERNGMKWNEIGRHGVKNDFLPNLTNFLDIGVNRKMVDNGLFYLNMHFQPNRQHTFQGNGSILQLCVQKLRNP